MVGRWWGGARMITICRSYCAVSLSFQLDVPQLAPHVVLVVVMLSLADKHKIVAQIQWWHTVVD